MSEFMDSEQADAQEAASIAKLDAKESEESSRDAIDVPITDPKIKKLERLDYRKYLELTNLETHGFCICQIYDSKNSEDMIGGHILKALISKMPAAEQKNFEKNPIYPAKGRAGGHESMFAYLKDITSKLYETPDNTTQAGKKKTTAEATEDDAPTRGKWTKKGIFHNLNSTSFLKMNWKTHHHDDAIEQSQDLISPLVHKLHQYLNLQITSLTLKSYHASVPHTRDDTKVDLCLVPPPTTEASYIGHLAATDVSFCMLLPLGTVVPNMDQVLRQGSVKLFDYLKSIIIPAGYALIHKPGLVFVPLEKLFYALYMRYLWACTFELKTQAMPVAIGHAPVEGVSDASAGSEVEGLETPQVKKRKKEAPPPAVYNSIPSHAPVDTYRTVVHTIDPTHVSELEKYIEEMQTRLDAPGATDDEKEIITDQMHKLHQTLKHARLTTGT